DRRSSARAAKAAQPHLSVHLPRPARGGGARLPPARDAPRQGGGGGRCRRGFCPAQESLHARLARRRFQPRGRARRRRRAVITARATNSVLTLPLVGRVGAKRGWGGRARTRQWTPPPTPPHKGEGSRPNARREQSVQPKSAR